MSDTQSEKVPQLPGEKPSLDLVKRRPGNGHLERVAPAKVKREKDPSELQFEAGEEARVGMAAMELGIGEVTPRALKNYYTFGRTVGRLGVEKIAQVNLIKSLQRTEATIKRFEKWIAECDKKPDSDDKERVLQTFLEDKQNYEMQFARINEKLAKAGAAGVTVEVPQASNTPFKPGVPVLIQNATFNDKSDPKP